METQDNIIVPLTEIHPSEFHRTYDSLKIVWYRFFALQLFNSDYILIYPDISPRSRFFSARYINRHRIFHTVFLSILALIVPLAKSDREKGARTGRGRARVKRKKKGGRRGREGRKEGKGGGRGLDEEQQQGDE